jgi:hypothetical protein
LTLPPFQRTKISNTGGGEADVLVWQESDIGILKCKVIAARLFRVSAAFCYVEPSCPGSMLREA